MDFFENIFYKKKKGESVVLIDIGAEGIAGAYVRYEENELPIVLYTKYVPIEIRVSEPHEKTMLRALRILGNTLIREGAPILVRTVGNGRADILLVSVDVPWQETTVRTESFESKKPFVFTRNTIAQRLEETNIVSSETMIADESVIGTILNGYETSNPYGKETSRASVIVLTSLIGRAIANNIITELRSLFHTTRIFPIAGSSIRYQAMRLAFPHEDNAIILDATGGSLISVALVRRGILNSIIRMEAPSEGRSWIETVTKEFSEIAKQFPLPRTIFLLARESNTSSLQKELETTNFGQLWLSDNPPKIVSILRNHVSGLIRNATDNPIDIILILMTLYFQKRRSSPDTIA